MSGSRFAELLRERLSVLGYGERGGQEKFRLLLNERHGLDVSSQSVSSWLTGQRVPSPAKLLVLLDVLGVHGREREAALRLAFGAAVPNDASNGEGL